MNGDTIFLSRIVFLKIASAGEESATNVGIFASAGEWPSDRSMSHVKDSS